MPTPDPAKRAAHNRMYYEKNRDAQRLRNQANRRRNYEHVAEIKARTPCTDCGVQYHPAVMEWDHTSDNKDAAVADLCHQTVSLARIDAEIAKCELVCANCHRLRTWLRKQDPATLA